MKVIAVVPFNPHNLGGRKINLINRSGRKKLSNLCSSIFLLHGGKKNCRYARNIISTPIHFVFYTISSESWSRCFAQSRQVDAVLPSFPDQNSETGSGSLARLSDTAAELDQSLLLRNVCILRCMWSSLVASLAPADTLEFCVQCFTRRLL